jgi:pimeloyl-ACP methyl ester carboxylesterase
MRSRVVALLALVLVVSACATPVGVERVDARTVHRTLTSNVLSHGRPSTPSVHVLQQLALLDRFESEPEVVLAELHGALPARGASDRLFALAELSFFHAEQTGDRSYFLAAAVYAYAFLLPGEEEAQYVRALDPRLRLAADLYNRGITEALKAEDEWEVILEPGTYPLPFGELELAVDPSVFVWGTHRLVRFVPAAEFQVRGLRNRYRHPGLGAPLAASIAPLAETPQEAGPLRIPLRLKVAVTALVRIEQPRAAVARGKIQARLELFSQDVADSVRLGGHQVPLEYEPTSSLAYTLNERQIWQFELRGFLSGEYKAVEDGLYMLHPYKPGRVPVVFVHGTASSPGRWAEMLNEMAADPEIGARCQFWLFRYSTGNPILYSANLLRRSRRDGVASLDPDGADPALQRIVIIGHSQGGLITKLMVIDSGSRFWDNVSPVPLDELDVTPETRDLLQESLFFEPVPFVDRVVFIATPHRGSFLAGGRLGRWASSLVTMPGSLARVGRDLVQRNPDTKALRSLEDIPTSVDNMDPSHHFIRTLAESPLADGVTAHSIIPVKGSGPPQKLSDGVVEYLSAHIEGVASETVVRSGHSTQSTPHTIEEVRRILREHVEAP